MKYFKYVINTFSLFYIYHHLISINVNITMEVNKTKRLIATKLKR